MVKYKVINGRFAFAENTYEYGEIVELNDAQVKKLTSEGIIPDYLEVLDEKTLIDPSSQEFANLSKKKQAAALKEWEAVNGPYEPETEEDEEDSSDNEDPEVPLN